EFVLVSFYRSRWEKFRRVLFDGQHERPDRRRSHCVAHSLARTALRLEDAIHRRSLPCVSGLIDLVASPSRAAARSLSGPNTSAPIEVSLFLFDRATRHRSEPSRPNARNPALLSINSLGRWN